VGCSWFEARGDIMIIEGWKIGILGKVLSVFGVSIPCFKVLKVFQLCYFNYYTN
jgi:hypothetical protein